MLIYYASADTRMHVAVSSVDKLLDYVLNTPEDPLRSYACVEQTAKFIIPHFIFQKCVTMISLVLKNFFI